MAIGEILIHKIGEENQIGCYEISSEHFNINNFYMCVDKSRKIIKFFLTKDFSNHPIRIIDYNRNDRMGTIPGIPTMVLSIALKQALRVFKMDAFPDCLSYAA